ncbi:Siderophore synthetase component [Nitrosomonas cryotolerans]|uniref:Siderophore synthetase component n=1 Tax=Nitrosomonas cryotolerans ATCC 49181 TaxID=1131553 RepID=A0A1N6I9K9_9PROT|nr:IucA/IucC family protein [Nitrosomonas cryotolerans]SFP83633.1 Siderophore synthetase component [Nitrosomonas cryotolerans]SIO28707.1 Siderophore synthetase component [Nitrosomonas cryotolerans ATCC 49181]
MKAILRKETSDFPMMDVSADHTQYIYHRVVDTLLRENVRNCVSQAVLMSGTALSARCDRHVEKEDQWLRISHLGNGYLWIPVTQSTFMQDWRSVGLPLLWQEGDKVEALHTLEALIVCFAHGLHSVAERAFRAFVDECRLAAEHRQVCETEREHWFTEYRALQGEVTGSELANWHTRLIHFDRLGAFLDHPFYPTARAKIGFDIRSLTAYSPEFQSNFLIHWLAVPRACFYPSASNAQNLPALWPSFETVGLPAELANTYDLIPVHPFVWEYELENLLSAAGMRDVIRAPWPYLTATPTLSVRTVVLLDMPEWHLKLPLTIRTLGAKNIRTIKPSTIHDGHRIQTLLASIAARELSIADRLVLTQEDCGGHVDHQLFLGYILRRYPVENLRNSTLVPVASLLAKTPAGCTVIEEMAAQFYDGDLEAFWNDYLDLTLRYHLLLWLRYGIALESNQQNSIVVLSQAHPRLRLLLKDNDAARIHSDYLAMRWPDLAEYADSLHDRRIIVSDALPLGQMFITITLQLNIAVLVEGIGPILGLPVNTLYANVRRRIETVLEALAADGEEISLARQLLLENERLHIKYLLIAATLTDKSETGANDVNKFYGMSSPNFLRVK